MYDQLDGLAPQSSERASTCRKDMILNYSADKTEEGYLGVFFFFLLPVSPFVRVRSLLASGGGGGGGVRD